MWEFRNDRPIYLQIIEQIKRNIVSGAYPPGSKIQSVRELAAEVSVNPNTMQKALSELEREGLVFSQRTLGRFITEDMEMIGAAKKKIAESQVEEFLTRMNGIGYTGPEITELLEEILKGDNL